MHPPYQQREKHSDKVFFFVLSNMFWVCRRHNETFDFHTKWLLSLFLGLRKSVGFILYRRATQVTYTDVCARDECNERAPIALPWTRIFQCLDHICSAVAQNGTQDHLDVCATKVRHSPFATISVRPVYAYSKSNICTTQVALQTASATKRCKANAAFHWKWMYFWCTKMQ